MRFNPLIVSSAAAVTLSCIVSAAAFYYKSRNKEINDVMVFCKLQLNAWNCFDKLISYIEGAKTSVDVCMPSIHNPAIQGRLVKLIKIKNIKVRIIIDRNGYNDSTDFLLKELLDAGAEIKCRVNERYNMQHKFCLIDDKILMTGTLNWGDDRSSDNWNYVYVTNKPQLVEPVKKEFNQMWNVDMNIEDALRTEPAVYESDDETPESLPRLTDSTIESGSENQSFQIPFLRETQVTPEVCIM
ncbi:mitochondrial cardiolipin hydrolase-like [Pectinophora gossypiella]|uniref:mitochondrial cardiolipin hydrolase-like n=1 Tax=Pectinophora gossypiella TaxID=13191 RepID=UPI00214DF234|nr:mitochondrial cardiolipin hydrolase-like [Pectinophora gossypiella]